MPDPTPAHSSRNHGLDTLRASAIALVFMYHYMIFVSHTPTFGWLSTAGWAGVDLFFVLSGYLIGNQLFAGLARGQALSLPRFYARRAFRTLPVFWVVLALYFLLPSVMGGRTPPPLWRFLTFTQNFGLPTGTAFSHAWSLCIEEQFYLVLPLVLAAGVAWKARRGHGWLLMGVLLALGIGARIVLWQRYGLEEDNETMEGYMAWVYYATLCRFDEFLPGLAVALLKNFHRPTWERITARGNTLLALGTVATAAVFAVSLNAYYLNGYGYGFFMTAFGYSLQAMAFALLVAAALSPSSWLYRVRVPGAHQLALWSYAIYLSHKPIAHILAQQLKGQHPGLVLAAVVACSLAGGWLLFKLVESPFMAWRDRLVPGNFRPAAGGDATVAATA